MGSVDFRALNAFCYLEFDTPYIAINTIAIAIAIYMELSPTN